MKSCLPVSSDLAQNDMCFGFISSRNWSIRTTDMHFWRVPFYHLN